MEDWNREVLKGFYSVFKAADADLQFVLLTGVTRFSQVSVFSGFNQPDDISLSARYDTLLGITEEEMKAKLKRQFDGSADAAIGQIKDKGYAREYEASPKRIHLIGCNFSSETGTIDGWEVR